MERETDKVEETLVALIARRAGIPEGSVRPGAHLIDFGLDSVQVTELLLDIEDALGVRIPDYDLPGLETVRDISAYIVKRSGKKA